MEHLQIAYDLLVIMIGLAALSIVVFWTARTGEADLRDFSIPIPAFPCPGRSITSAPHLWVVRLL